MRQRQNHSRRTLLKAGLGTVAAPALVRAATRGPQRGQRTLVMLHLAGGNDGLNTLIPYADEHYHAQRPRLSRPARDVRVIDDAVGFHPALRRCHDLYHAGRLAIVQGVGYPDPDYSHVGACRVWATGNPCAATQRGWLDAIVERDSATLRVRAVCLGSDRSPMIAAAPATSVYVAPAAANPVDTLVAAARVAAADAPPPLIFATVSGFDTHTDQIRRHGNVLGRLDEGLSAFQREVEARGVADRVLLVAWSEFGRRLAENATGGTDHGTAGPVFVLGTKVRGGLYGQAPALDDTDPGSITHTVDFRTVYATLASRWLRQRDDVLAERFEPLSFV